MEKTIKKTIPSPNCKCVPVAEEVKKDNINPNHYRAGKIEVIEIMKDQLSEEQFKGFCKGLILKYLCRADHKNGLEDYKKAQWYLNYLIKTMEEKNSPKEN